MVSIYLDDSNRPRTTINDFEVHLCVFTPSFILKIVPVSGASTIACAIHDTRQLNWLYTWQVVTQVTRVSCTDRSLLFSDRPSARARYARCIHQPVPIDLEDFNRAVNSFRQRMEACLTNQLRRRRHARHTPRTSDTADQRKAEGNSRTSEVRILRHLNQPLKAGHSQCDSIEYHRQHGVAPIPSRYPEVAITSAWTIATPTTPRLVAPTARKTANGFRWT